MLLCNGEDRVNTQSEKVPTCSIWTLEKSQVPEPCDGKLSCTVLRGGKPERAYLSNQRLKPYQYLYVYYMVNRVVGLGPTTRFHAFIHYFILNPKFYK
jgi:hypothetical protein